MVELRDLQWSAAKIISVPRYLSPCGCKQSSAFIYASSTSNFRKILDNIIRIRTPLAKAQQLPSAAAAAAAAAAVVLVGSWQTS